MPASFVLAPRRRGEKLRVLARESRERLERRAPALAHRALQGMTSQTSESNGVAVGVDGGVEIACRARIRGLVSRRRRRLSGRVVKVKPLVRAHRSAAFARGNVTAPRKVGRPRVGRPCVGRASRLVSFSFGKNSVPGGHLSGTGPLRRGLDRTRESRKRIAEFIRHEAHDARSSAPEGCVAVCLFVSRGRPHLVGVTARFGGAQRL